MSLRALVAVLAACACGGSATLKSRVESHLAGGPGYSACDVTAAPLQREIAAALEARSAEIDALELAGGSVGEDAYRTVAVGPARLREFLHPPGNPGEWVEITKSWQDLYQRFQAVRDRPTDRRWLKLLRDTSSIETDDARRLAGIGTFNLDELSGAYLPDLVRAADACLHRSSCTKPEVSHEAWVWVVSIPGYAEDAAILDGDAGTLRKQRALGTLRKVFLADLQSLVFHPNRHVSREGDVLWIQGDAGDFAGAERDIDEIVRRVWAGEHLSVRIRWASSVLARTFAGLHFRFSPVVNQRAHTEYAIGEENFEIIITSGMTVTAIGHELGHVLGFPDAYFTLWDPRKCEYRVRQHVGDIMSSKFGGVATAAEWEALEQAYR
jgi:hypothetical protein